MNRVAGTAVALATALATLIAFGMNAPAANAQSPGPPDLTATPAESPAVRAGSSTTADVDSISAEAHPGTPGASPALVVGEKLTFSIRYGKIPAGEATLEIAGVGSVRGIRAWQLRATAASSAVFDKVYPVRDRWESWIDLDSLWCLRFEKSLREGRYRKDLALEMDQEKGEATYHDGRVVPIPHGTYDVIGAFYYVRAVPLVEGAKFLLDSHENRKNYPLEVSVVGKEDVVTEMGTFRCWVVEPKLASGAFFKNEGQLTLWLTDDERRIPVQMRSKIPVGAITAVLTKMERPEPIRD